MGDDLITISRYLISFDLDGRGKRRGKEKCWTHQFKANKMGKKQVQINSQLYPVYENKQYFRKNRTKRN